MDGAQGQMENAAMNELDARALPPGTPVTPRRIAPPVKGSSACTSARASALLAVD